MIHGPYQSGKTSFLWGLDDELRKEITVTPIYFDMSGVKGEICDHGEQEGFFRYFALQLFSEPLNRSQLTLRIGALRQHYCLLVDEFQYVYGSKFLLSTAKDYFRMLGSNRWISYVAVGTYQLVALPDDDDFLVLPFNKASFLQIPFFSALEMSQLFQMYELHINPDKIPLDVQLRIMEESNGHPASFMILLRLYNECRPKRNSWSLVLQENLSTHMNGTHRKVKHALNRMTKDGKARVRELTSNGTSSWESKLDTPEVNPTGQRTSVFWISEF